MTTTLTEVQVEQKKDLLELKIRSKSQEGETRVLTGTKLVMYKEMGGGS